MIDFDYASWFQDNINQLKTDLSSTFPILKNFNIIVSDEQNFIKEKQMDPFNIFVVLKRSASTIVFTTTVQPYQIIILTEQNSLETTKLLFDEFAHRYNFDKLKVSSDVFIKQQYSESSVMQNFTNVGVGYKSIIYMTTNLYIMENVADISDMYYVYGDGDDEKEKVNFITANIGYGASMDTVQFPSSEISDSVKIGAVLTLTLTVPVQKSRFMRKILEIMADRSNANDTFTLDFNVGIDKDEHGEEIPYVKFDKVNGFKLQNSTYVGAVNNIPSIQISFVR